MSSVSMADRTKFLGGSDAAGILGLSRWETPLSIWAKKTNQGQVNEEETLPQKLGKKLEPIVGELFTEATGLKLRRVTEHKVHPTYPFLAAQIDFYVVGDDSICECKTASGWKAKEWAEDEIPQEYIIQGMHQMAVTGKKKCYVAVLIGGNQEFKVKELQRDEDLIRQLIQKEVSFWNDFVVPRVMPKIITQNDAETLYNLFPRAVMESQIDLGDVGARLIEMRNGVCQDQIALEAQRDKLENEIKALLQEKESGSAGKWLVTWKNQTTKRLDTKTLKMEQPAIYDQFAKDSLSRVLRIKENKNVQY